MDDLHQPEAPVHVRHHLEAVPKATGKVIRRADVRQDKAEADRPTVAVQATMAVRDMITTIKMKIRVVRKDVAEAKAEAPISNMHPTDKAKADNGMMNTKAEALRADAIIKAKLETKKDVMKAKVVHLNSTHNVVKVDGTTTMIDITQAVRKKIITEIMKMKVNMIRKMKIHPKDMVTNRLIVPTIAMMTKMNVTTTEDLPDPDKVRKEIPAEAVHPSEMVMDNEVLILANID